MAISAFGSAQKRMRKGPYLMATEVSVTSETNNHLGPQGRKKSRQVIPERIGADLRRHSPACVYDAVIIGSGIGGLSAAVALAKQGKRVAVFEQHYTAGGCTHAFTRKGWEWDVGIHYIGSLGLGEPIRVLSEYFTDGRLSWASMGDPYDEYHIGSMKFVGRPGFRAMWSQLREQFPARADRRALRRVLLRVLSVPFALPPLALERIGGRLSWKLAQLYRRYVAPYALRPSSEVLSELVENPQLRLALQLMPTLLLGMSPRDMPFFVAVGLHLHYITGAWYPVGGSSQIALTMLPLIREAGGEVFVNAPVERILTDDNTAVGVRLASGLEVRAPLVISAAGAKNTFGKLLDPQLAERHGYLQKVERARNSDPFMVLFFGLDESTESLKLPPSNTFVLDDELFMSATHTGDLSPLVDKSRGAPTPDDASTGVFLSFPSAKDPTWSERHPDRSVGEMIIFGRHNWFREWEDTQWDKRGAEYETLKERMTEQMLEILYRNFPHLEGHVKHYELATPLTTEHFIGWPEGGAYGISFEDKLTQGDWLRPKTRVQGLFLAGQDATLGSLSGAWLGGVAAALSALGPVDKARLLGALGRIMSRQAVGRVFQRKST